MSDIGRFVRSINFLQYKNYCNLCNRYFVTFSDAGEPPRRAVRCPDCNSLERHRLEWEYMSKETEVFTRKGLKLLHIAPEITFYNKFSTLKNLDYTGIDIDPAHLGLENLNVSVGDARKMKFKDNTFDVIVCNHVLEHIIEDVKAMKEIRRVLKKDGIAIIDVPIDFARAKTYEDASIVKPQARLKAFGQDDHVRIYGTDFYDRMEKAGLHVIKLNYKNMLSPLRRRRLSLQDNPLMVVYKNPRS